MKKKYSMKLFNLLIMMLISVSVVSQTEINRYEKRINSGGSEINYEGEIFSADSNFNTGNILIRPQTGLDSPFSSLRYSPSKQMNYEFNIPDGEYKVNLYFAELWFGATGGGSGGIGSRVFDVSIEGNVVENNLDVLAEVGAETILMKSHTVTVTDGVLNINFDSRAIVGGERHPIINAIEILGDEKEILESKPFITTWKTDNEGDSSDNQIKIPTNPNEQYLYRVDWGDGTLNENVMGDVSHSYANPGTYQVSISGIFPSITFGVSGKGDREKIININQWGDIQWTTMEASFLACINMEISATDVPDLSNATSLKKTFYASPLISNYERISNWDVSNIEDMSQLFSETAFNIDISNWDVGNVKTTYAMFLNTTFNQDIGNWDTSNIESMRQMFMYTPFNQDIGDWDVSKVKNFGQMFTHTPFNRDISGWDMSSATRTESMFDSSPFNQDISGWNFENLEDSAFMFDKAANFNQDISSWNMAKVKYAQGMFRDAVSFNQDLSNWNTENLVIAQQMFKGAISFDQNIGSWNIEKVTNMDGMFAGVTLSSSNYDNILNSWSLQNIQSSVEFDGGDSQYCQSQEVRQRMQDAFGWVIVDGGKIADCDLSDPDSDFALRFNTGGDAVQYNGNEFLVDNNFLGSGSVLKRPQTGLPEPYQSFRFNRDLRMFYNIPLHDGDYIVNLYFAELWFGATDGGSGGIGSRIFDVNMEGQLTEDNLDVFSEVGAETVLMKSYTVNISDGVLNIDFDSRSQVGGSGHPIINAIEILSKGNEEMRPFITTWEARSNQNNQVTIPTEGSGYNYTVKWGDGSVDSNVTGDITHRYTSSGTYSVSISGEFPRLFFAYDSNNYGLFKSVDQWGDIIWINMESAFDAYGEIEILAEDTPNLNAVTSMKRMFADVNIFINDKINEWDVSNVVDMSELFYNSDFNQEIGNWDVKNVQKMKGMFGHSNFNGNIQNWEVQNVTDMQEMFIDTPFNQNIGDWNVSNVSNMSQMFRSAPFDQDISNWNVSEVMDMSKMFRSSTFNKDLGSWDVQNVENMSEMFLGNTYFNQNLGSWKLANAIDLSNMLNVSGMSTENYDATLEGWSEQGTLKNSIEFGAVAISYCKSEVSRQKLITDFGWIITDEGQAEDCKLETFNSIFVNAGGLQITTDNKLFYSDQNFDSGSIYKNVNTNLSGVYTTERYGPEKKFNYAFDVENGTYSIKLHFAEIYWGATGGGSGSAGKRVFDVTIEDQLVLDDYDIFAEVGAAVPSVKEFIIKVIDGNLVLSFDSSGLNGVDSPKVSAIEIIKKEESDFKPFITTWEIDKDFVKTISATGDAYNYDISWGDGTSDSGVTGEITHKYEEDGIYQISITGIFSYFRSSASDMGHHHLLSVDQWGDIIWDEFDFSFRGEKFLDVKAEDVPNLSNVESLAFMFYGCSSLTGDTSFSEWDVSKITNMNLMFAGSTFNGEINSWNVSNVTSMSGMFGYNYIDTNGEPALYSSFNQPLDNWDVSNVVNMDRMFENNADFNQDISSWKIENVNSMSRMLYGSQYKPSSFSGENYDKLLTGWSEQQLQNNVVFDANNKQYCEGADARQKLIDDFGWTISDAGKSPQCEEPNDYTFSINAGGSEAFYNEKTFVEDTYYNTGSTLDRPQTGLPEPYQSMRYSRSQQMDYSIPLEDGQYTINLYFAELWFGSVGGGSGGVGSRVFDVSIEGSLAEDNLDVFAEAGADAMLMKSQTVTVTDGVLNINFDSRNQVGGARHPIINAIEIVGASSSLSAKYASSKKVDEILPATENAMRLYPNQASTFTTISFEESTQINRVFVYDISGRLIESYNPKNNLGENGYVIDVSFYQQGNYIVKVVDENGLTQSQQMVVKH